MTYRQMIGLLMLSVPFVGLFVFIGIGSSWVLAFLLYGSTIAAMGFILTALYLLSDRGTN